MENVAPQQAFPDRTNPFINRLLSRKHRYITDSEFGQLVAVCYPLIGWRLKKMPRPTNFSSAMLYFAHGQGDSIALAKAFLVREGIKRTHEPTGIPFALRGRHNTPFIQFCRRERRMRLATLRATHNLPGMDGQDSAPPTKKDQ
jgi:hypothetical protein